MASFEEQGWRQGSVLPRELGLMLIPDPPSLGVDDIAVVVSQDCDVTNSSLMSEPTVEVIIGRPVRSEDGGLKHGRNPRRIQFPTSAVDYEASVHERFVLDRAHLRDRRPDETTLDPATVRSLASWLARRYDRVAFPTAFNDRLKPRRKTVFRELKRCGVLSAVYLLMSPEELDQESDYVIGVCGSVTREHDNSTDRETAVKALDKLCVELGKCVGIVVTDHEVRSESEITLDDLRFFRRWDVDYLSERADPPDAPAPRP